MKLTIINGSPRGKNSNSKILADKFAKGFLKPEDEKEEIFLIEHQGKYKELIKSIEKGELFYIVFPLYVDSMPGMVKEFIDELEPFKGKLKNKKFIYHIHCGFPEELHLHGLKNYLTYLTKILDAELVGVMTSGGSEGSRFYPKGIKFFVNLEELGKKYRETGKLDEELFEKVKRRKKFNSLSLTVAKFFNKIGLLNVYWNHQLKKNGVYDKRFDKPYEDS